MLEVLPASCSLFQNSGGKAPTGMAPEGRGANAGSLHAVVILEKTTYVLWVQFSLFGKP